MRNFIITVNGQQYQVGVEEVAAGASAAPVVSAPAPAPAASVAAPVPAAQPAPAPIAPAAAPAPVSANAVKVLAPFPGLIKGLLVDNGTSVKKDQPILVLEAMKMDNDITAPCDGVVTFSVQKGSNVDSDALLATIG